MSRNELVEGVHALSHPLLLTPRGSAESLGEQFVLVIIFVDSDGAVGESLRIYERLLCLACLTV